MNCHIGSQQGRVPTQARAGRPDNERSVGGAWPVEWRCDIARGLKDIPKCVVNFQNFHNIQLMDKAIKILYVQHQYCKSMLENCITYLESCGCLS